MLNKVWVRDFIKSFLRAWDMLLDVPPPAVLSGIKGVRKAEGRPALVLAGFPLVGALVGGAAVLACWFLSRLTGPAAAAFLGAAAVFAFLEIVTAARGLRSLVSLADSKGAYLAALAGLRDTQSEPRSLTALLTIGSFFVVRVGALGFLIFHAAYAWVAVVLVLSYSLKAALAQMDELDMGAPLVELEDSKGRFYPWVLGFLAALAFGAAVPFEAILGMLACVGYYQVVKSFLTKNLGGTTGAIIGLFAYIFETAMLVFGVALLG